MSPVLISIKLQLLWPGRYLPTGPSKTIPYEYLHNNVQKLRQLCTGLTESQISAFQLISTYPRIITYNDVKTASLAGNRENNKPELEWTIIVCFGCNFTFKSGTKT